jgi:hypothetical protein
VSADIVTAQGCFKPLTTVSQIPKAEYGILRVLAPRGPLHYGPNDLVKAVNGVLDLTDAYIATGPVRVNGVDLIPKSGASVIVAPKEHAIVSSNAAVEIGGIGLAAPPDFVLDTKTVGGGIPLGSFARLPGFLKSLGFFDLTDNVDVTLDKDGAVVTVHLKLPDFLNVGGGPGVGQVTMRATMADGLKLDQLVIGPLNLGIGPLGVNDFQISYKRVPNDEWAGQGSACLTPGLPCLDMLPKDGGGVVIRHGEFYRAGASLTFPGEGIEVVPGISLHRIGFFVGLHPTRFGGNVLLNAYKLVDIDGRLVLALPTAAEPYYLTPEDAGQSFPADFYKIPFTSPTFAIGGDAYINVPVVGSTRVGGAYFLYSYPGKLAFGGVIDASFLDVVSVKGGVEGAFNFENGRFNLGGHIHACIADVICSGADINVSNRGAGGCVQYGPLNIGGGVQWDGPTIKIWPFDGCKWSRFAEMNVFAAGAAQVRSPLSVKIKPGDPSTAIELDGTDGAPRVRVSGPGGASALSTDGPGLQITKQVRIMRSQTLKRTIVGLVNPVPGTYTITSLDGSPRIEKVLTAKDQPTASVTAVVRGSGTRRRLTYDIRPRQDQRVTFIEKGPEGQKDIGTVTGGGKGTVRFTTAPGLRPRQVDAQFELAGLPAERITIAHFTPPSPLLAGPHRLRVRRRGDTLSVSWAPVRDATRYELVLTPSDGPQRLVHTTAHNATIRRVARTLRGSVRVRAVADLRQGPPASTTFRALEHPHTRFGRLPKLKRALLGEARPGVARTVRRPRGRQGRDVFSQAAAH